MFQNRNSPDINANVIITRIYPKILGLYGNQKHKQQRVSMQKNAEIYQKEA